MTGLVTRPLLGAVFPLRASIGGAATSNRPGRSDPTRTLDALREPLGALAENGVEAVTIPIDWARLEPRQGHWSPSATEEVGRLLEYCSGIGLQVWGCLFDGEVPQWFDDGGAFGDAKQSVRHWPRFVERVAGEFGDRMSGWVPLERPAAFARSAYIDGTWPPNRSDPRQHSEVVTNLVTAWRDAWRILQGPHPVHLSLDLERIVVPRDDVKAAERARWRDHVAWTVWTGLWRDGTIQIPGFGDRPLADLAHSGDGIRAWLPPPGPDAEWAGELLRRLGELVEIPIHAVIRLGERKRSADHVGQQLGLLTDAVHDSLPIRGLWASPARAAEVGLGELVDAGGAPTDVLELWAGAPMRVAPEPPDAGHSTS